jgi:hypothetical protein
MKRKHPRFLEGTEVSNKEKERYAELMSNWLKIHGFIKEMDAEEQSLDVLKKMMLVEYRRKEGPRMDIIVRLHGRYQVLRHEVERVELGQDA